MSIDILINVPSLVLNDKDKENKIRNLLEPLIIKDDRTSRIQTVFLEEVERGLQANPVHKSSLQMENTFVPKLLEGNESGEYMALDLGSTNFRIVLLKLQNGKIVQEIIDHYDIPEAKKLGPGCELFDFMALCIKDFITKKDLLDKHIKLGFTFSFPMTQKAIDIGILLTWTKSYTCSGVVGEDVVKLLSEAIERQGGLNVTVMAVLNDTTGTLIKGSYLDKRCAMSMILGTGNNACYIEQVNNIEKWKNTLTNKEMIIDVEWGAFGDNGCLDFLRTEWDDKVDSQSLIPKSFLFEKYIGGKFLGDIARECLKTLNEEQLFGKTISDKLSRPGSFTTTNLSNVEKYTLEGNIDMLKLIRNQTLEIGEELSQEEQLEDSKVLQYVCALVSYRAAQLASILAATMLERMKRPHCTIAIDGSVYEQHPRFKPLMDFLIHKYAPDFSFDIIMARDGSGTGAALVAAIADHIKNN